MCCIRCWEVTLYGPVHTQGVQLMHNRVFLLNMYVCVFSVHQCVCRCGCICASSPDWRDAAKVIGCVNGHLKLPCSPGQVGGTSSSRSPSMTPWNTPQPRGRMIFYTGLHHCPPVSVFSTSSLTGASERWSKIAAYSLCSALVLTRNHSALVKSSALYRE